ncbi:GMC family oxidoreductase [Rhodococcus sp. MSC1_016]|jgi:choline dehydrogenase|uniref:GMC family oxidoreductase n=1 Tax=Rhodococcus sp. MSC1_016 TaxID=2909266 RepID=UPI0020301317|nr:GMC family oxidoreductase N-terminal domain-containing protein [Rhodococcus sp. MSC1_016]
MAVTRSGGSTAVDDTFDYVVVGAGSSGAVVAARLSEDPSVSVCLLEAGGTGKSQSVMIPAAFSQQFRSDLDWNYDTSEQKELDGRAIFYPLGKMLGGSSSMNAMMWVRGFAHDYDAWAQAAGDEWGWAAMSDVFLRIEDSDTPGDGHGRGGPQSVRALRSPSPLTEAFLRACVEAGHSRSAADDVNDGHQDGFWLTPVTQRRGVRASTSRGYLDAATKRTNLSVRTDFLVEQLVIDDSVTVGVRGHGPGGRRVIGARREVVVSAGAINTPKLLMLSGIGPADQLRHHGIDVVVDARQVGHNLLDHLFAPIVAETVGTSTLFTAQSPRQLANFLIRRRGMLTSNVAEAFGFVRSDPALQAPDLELLFAPAPFVKEGLEPAQASGITAGAIVAQPRSSGIVSLRSGDASDAPVIDPAYLTDDEGADRAVLLAGLRMARDILRAPSLRGYITGMIQPLGADLDAPDDELVEQVLTQHAHTLYHPTSTCRMGRDEAAVVDPDLRVRGVGRLRVADASVMPTIMRGHPNAACIAIGERAADLLARAERQPV